MRFSLALTLLAALTLGGAWGQGPGTLPALPPAPPAGPPITLQAKNATLRQIVRNMSAANIRDTIAHLVSFGTRNALAEFGPSSPRGASAARTWIAAQFQRYAAASGGRLQVHIDSFTVPPMRRIPPGTIMANVVAVLPGDDPADHRIFIIGGDYDSRNSNDYDTQADAPGANDDASGTALALECARVMSRFHFSATLEFIAFDGEEQGLIGAQHDAQTDKAAGKEIAAMIDNDIVGGDNTPGQANTNRMRVFSEALPDDTDAALLRRIGAIGGENDSASRELSRFAAGVAALYLPSFHVVQEFRRDRVGRGGDHMAYLQQGFTAVRFTDYYENYHHQHQNVRVQDGIQYGDLIRFTTPSYTANIARVNALTMAALALAPPPPARVVMRRDGPHTRLEWDAVPGAAVYHVLLRPTIAPQWTERIPVKGTTVELRQSMDNYFIGVVAVSANGLESLPAMAAPPMRRPPPGTEGQHPASPPSRQP